MLAEDLVDGVVAIGADTEVEEMDDQDVLEVVADNFYRCG